jgi:hypothetical protein
MQANQLAAAVQPNAGDTYLHCGHARPDVGFHLWMCDGRYTRPDGTTVTARWFACCHRCFRQAKGNMAKVRSRGDATFTGDEHPAAALADTGYHPVVEETLDSLPGVIPALTTAAARFHTNNLVVVGANPRKQGRLIRNDLRAGKFPAEPLPGKGLYSGFVVTVPTATQLLRAHCGAGGEYVATHLEERAQLNECWTLTAGGNWVDACAYRYLKATFYTVSDVRGKKQYAEAVQPD